MKCLSYCVLFFILAIAPACSSGEKQAGQAKSSSGKEAAKPVAKEQSRKTVDAADYYVSALSVDSSRRDADGSLDKPFPTIQAAADVAQAGEVVVVLEGIYRESVRPKHSGTKGKPIVFKANTGDRVIIRGSDPVAGWKADRKGRFVAPLKKRFESVNNQSMQVFVDDQMMHLARYPNLDVGTYELFRPKRLLVEKVVSSQEIEKIDDKHVKARITIRSKDFDQPAGAWDGAKMHIRPMWKWGWGMPRSGHIVSSKPGEIVFDIPNYEILPQEQAIATIIRDNHAGKRNCPFYVFGSLAGLDHPGEWFHDTDAGVLYLMPPSGVSLAEAEVEVKMRDWAFDLSERSHIRIEGFELFACSITTDVKSGTGIAEVYPNDEVRKDGIAPASHIIIDGIDARYVSHFTDLDGFILSQWRNNTGVVLSGENHVLQNSRIAISAGNLVTLLGRNHKVSNNILYGAGYTGTETGWVAEGWGKCMDYEVSYNTMYTAGGNGMHCGNAESTNPAKPVAIHHNVMNDVGSMRDDIGFIYSFGNAKGSYAHFHHNVLYSNTAFQGFGIYHDYGGYWRNYDNIVFDTSWASCMHTNEKQGESISYSRNILWGIGNSVLGNQKKSGGKDVHVSENIMHGLIRSKPPSSVFEKNFEQDKRYMDLYQFFADPAALDFSLKSKRKELSNVGPLDFGEEMFRVGSTLEPIVKAPTHLKAQIKEDGSVALSWKDHAANEEGYVVERSTYVEETYMFDIRWEPIATLPADATSYIDRPTASGKTYYRVRAIDSRTTNLAFISQDAARVSQSGL